MIPHRQHRSRLVAPALQTAAQSVREPASPALRKAPTSTPPIPLTPTPPHLHTSILPGFHTPILPNFLTYILPNSHTYLLPNFHTFIPSNFHTSILPYLFLLLFLASCGPPERDPNTIEFWTLQLSPTFDDYIDGVIDAFEDRHPGISINWVDVPYEGITQKYLSAIAAGRSPDVVNLPADFVPRYVGLSALEPLDRHLDDSIRHAYLQPALEPLIVEGALYGVPWYLATKITIYDAARLERAGLGGELPATYGELLRFARRYHDATGSYAFFYNLVVESYLFQVLASEGIPIVSEDGQRALFNTPRAAEIIGEWVETFQAGVLPRESIFSGHQGGIEMYQSGTVAMFIGAPQFLRIVRENAPRIFETTDVAPAVVGEAEVKELDVMSLAVSSKAANPQLAADFASFVTNAENQLAFARLVPIFPSVTAALEDPFFQEEDGSLESRARVIAAGQLPDARVLRPIVRDYNRLHEVFKDHMLRAFLGHVSVEEALARAERDWNRILAEDW